MRAQIASYLAGRREAGLSPDASGWRVARSIFVATGAFGTVLYTGHDWSDPPLARRSMELTAKEVWPRIERELDGFQ